MSIRVIYKTLTNAPVLLTPKGRIQLDPVLKEAKKPDYTRPMGLYEGSQHSGLRLNVRRLEQDRVLKEARAKISALSQTIDQLDMPQTDNILLEKTASSSKPQALSLEADREADTSAVHTLRVHWPAAGRTIDSAPQNPVGEVSLADGEHQFTMVIDGAEHTLSVNVHNTPGEVDTQEDVLRRLAREISIQDSRVAARVEYGETDAYDPNPRSRPMDRTATLKVYSTQEGEGVEFYFEDADGGGLVSEYGLNLARPQRSARVEQEGAFRLQSTNSISLDDGHVTGEIYSDTSGAVEAPVDYAAEVVPAGLNRLIGQYNDLVDYLASHSDVLRPSLLDRVTRPVQERARELPGIGLYTNARGSIKSGPEFETKAQYNYGQVREVLLDEGGWVQNLDLKLDQILALEEDAFALPLSGADQFEERRRAWALVDSLSSGIINGYT